MAISARIPVGLDTNTFIPDFYSKNVLEAVKKMLVIVPIVNHSYEAELQKGEALYIAKTNTVTATEVTIGTEGVVKNPFNTAGVILTIDQYYEAPVVIDYMSRRQSHIDLRANAELESAYALKEVIDSSLAALFDALSGGGGYGTDGSAVTDDVLIAAVEELDEADVPPVNRTWVFDPSVKADILKIDKFVRVDYFAGDTILTGMFRKDIYGAPMLVTNNLAVKSTGNVGAYLHKNALAIAIQENMKVDRVEQPLKHQLVINTTALWGVIELQDTFGCEILTRKS
ncbi:hypothetical protein LCGC14_2025140 [marine sediment metagenome]|uniref:Capsid protein n=1 Tax=marine sediment metagenome TaxID=412755 RepID=A0A0F9H9Q1_9ZZZZ